MNATLVARPIYGGGEGTRQTLASRGQHTSAMLASYAEVTGDFSEVCVHYLITGKRTVPVSLVKHYADGTACSPNQLYNDLKSYIGSPAIPANLRKQLLDNLYEVLECIPAIDKNVILEKVNACDIAEDRIYRLFSSLLYYAWRTDLAGYTYVEV